MLQRVGLQFAGLGVVWLGEYQVVDQLRHPAIVALGEGLAGLGQHLIGTPHRRHVTLAGRLRWQWVEVGRVAVVEPHVALIDGPDVMAERAVVVAAVPFACQARRQAGQGLGNFHGRLALIDQAQGLAVDEGIHIALVGQVVADGRTAPSGPVMLGEHHLGLLAVAHQRLVQVMGPHFRIAHQGPAQRQYVVLHMGGVLGHAQCPERREINVHFRRRLGARGQLELHLHAAQGHALQRLADFERRRDEADSGIGRHALAQSGIHLASRPTGQGGAVHVLGAAFHGRSGQHVFADGMFEEPLGRDDLDFASLDVRLVDHPAHAAEMVDVRVGVDHRGHRLARTVLEVQFEARLGGLHGKQRIDHDQPVLPLDDGHVGQVQAAKLVDALGDLEQPGDVVQLSDAPQARVYRGRGLRRFQKSILGQVPHGLAIGCRDWPVEPLDQPTPGCFVIDAILERQPLQPLLVAGQGGRGGILGRCCGQARKGGQQGKRQHRQ